MSNVEFDRSNLMRDMRPRGGGGESRGLMGFIIRAGLAKDERGASYFLIGLIIVCLGAIVFLLYSMSPEPQPTVSPAEVQRALDAQRR